MFRPYHIDKGWVGLLCNNVHHELIHSVSDLKKVLAL